MNVGQKRGRCAISCHSRPCVTGEREVRGQTHSVSLHSVGPVDELLSTGGSEEIGAVVDTNVKPKIVKFVQL